MAITYHIKDLTKGKGHQLLIALLLFFYSSFGFASSPFRTKLDSLSSKQVWLISHVVPGSGQFINKQYWKIPVFYAGMGSMLYLGYQANQNYLSTISESKLPIYGPDDQMDFKEKWTQYKIERNIYYTTAGAFYLGSVADALIVHTKGKHSPLTASVLSTLIPGMGQVYNQKLWKVPFVFGGIASLYYIVDLNQRGYKRFADAYNKYPNDEFGGLRSEADLLYLRDAYRRNRDLSLIGLVAFYGLNIIDAYIDANFFNWEINDNLALHFEPTIQNGVMASNWNHNPTLGLRINLKIK